MKTRILLFILTLGAGIFSCSSEDAITDPIYEFVSFIGNSSVNLNEYVNSEEAYPVVVQLWAFKPYQEDIDLTLEVTPDNAVKDVDFTLPTVLKIRAGSLTSDTLWVQTIDNGDKNDERSFEVKITAVSKPDIKIGFGIAEPEKLSITFQILDDECDATTDIYNTAGLVNTINAGTTKTVTGVLNNNTIKLTGDLVDYGPFSNASLTLTLTPSASSATRGSATFGEQETGTDTDGYEYKFIEVGEGSYDVCSGTISIEYKIYYMDSGAWKYWYSATNVFSVP